MSDESDDIILIYLRRLETKMGDVSDRLTRIERVAGRMSQDLADFRMDMLRMEGRAGRIERRLDGKEADTH